MTDRFSIIPFRQLVELILYQLNTHNHLFGIPQSLFFHPSKSDAYRFRRFGQLMENPIGVAAGPQTQLTQNIVISWLLGARYIELKTIQTLDELEVTKPCIDMQDEGYNCEWSQELKIKESFDQYLNAWILIHILKHKFKHDLSETGFIFNMSVGYDYKGILNENVQWFFDKMNDASDNIQIKIQEISDLYPDINEIAIGSCISNNITLSTMHGCPPEEIEQIGQYLISDKKLHTAIKLNPTLLGKEKVVLILSKSGFKTEVPDEAFEHDLKMKDAIGIINRLQKLADTETLKFSLKLTNTLESRNNREVFPKKEEMMYMSGRPLHPIAINLANELGQKTDKILDISFSAGVDAFNLSDVVKSGLFPVTICSDLLKPGGYGRLQQYLRELTMNIESDASFSIENSSELTQRYLKTYAATTIDEARYKNLEIGEKSIKTSRLLTTFDCVEAPCIGTCPARQNIPAYLHFTAEGDFKKAFEYILDTNPFPNATGYVCDHTCQYKCTRMDYDQSLAIRDIKRFIAEKNPQLDPGEFSLEIKEHKAHSIAIIGAGPSGLSCAYFARKAGFHVEIFETGHIEGGMVSKAIPAFRIAEEPLEIDIARIRSMGIVLHFEHQVDKVEFESLHNRFDFVYISTGAQGARKLNIPGLPEKGILNPLAFLMSVKQAKQVKIGPEVIIIGGGNTAMDAARTARRLVAADNGRVRILYRRSMEQMPAEAHEITDAIKEGIEIVEFCSPVEAYSENGQLTKIRFQKMELGEKDESGRKRPVPIKGAFVDYFCDTLIPALGQEIRIDFVDLSLLETKNNSYQTQLDRVFIGGDAMRGAATLIKAIGDGKNAAQEILSKIEVLDLNELQNKNTGLSIEEHMIKRMTRDFQQKKSTELLNKPVDFNLVEQTLTDQVAILEAKRCLHCDEVCNICTTVCPNLSLLYFPVKQQKFQSHKISQYDGQNKAEIIGEQEIKQEWQILHIADWCNECGNCNTFCPTAGAPYLSKPHFYFNYEAFNAEKDGYFMRGDILKAKFDGMEYELEEDNDHLLFKGSNFTIKLKKSNFGIEQIKTHRFDNFSLETKHAIDMYLVLQGVKYLFGKNKAI